MDENINVLCLYNRKRNADGDKARKLAACIAERCETDDLGPVYYADRDALPGTDVFDELARVIDSANVIICIVTGGFVGCEWNLWTSKIAYKHKLESGDEENQARKQTFVTLKYDVTDEVLKKKCSIFRTQEAMDVPRQYDAVTGTAEYDSTVQNFWRRLLYVVNQQQQQTTGAASVSVQPNRGRPLDERNARMYAEHRSSPTLPPAQQLHEVNRSVTSSHSQERTGNLPTTYSDGPADEIVTVANQFGNLRLRDGPISDERPAPRSDASITAGNAAVRRAERPEQHHQMAMSPLVPTSSSSSAGVSRPTQSVRAVQPQPGQLELTSFDEPQSQIQTPDEVMNVPPVMGSASNYTP